MTALLPAELDALWIGLTDTAQEGDWVWVTGEKADFKAWAPGEPNNVDGNENGGEGEDGGLLYARAEGRGLWNDVPRVRFLSGCVVEVKQ